MTDPQIERMLAQARRAEPTWSAGRQQQLKWTLMARLERGRRPALVLVLAGIALVGLGGAAWRRMIGSPARGPAGTVAQAPARASEVPAPNDLALPRLADGSSIVLDGPSAILKTLRETSDEVVVELGAGGAHFEVARRPSRIFRVQAGPVTVQVIGTRFHVQREGARTRISVDRGRVLTSWWGGSRELGAGEQGTFPPEVPSAVAPPAAAPAPPPALEGSRVSTPSVASTSRRVVASSASSSRAERTGAAPPPVATPETLFAQADRARVEGRPEAAVARLREIVDRFPRDPHAPMAAFTMGRLLLESLHQPGSAAAAFGQARLLANGGPLAEDALARQVEALHAAGDLPAARDRAELYRTLFPHGPRLRTVLRFGGVQATQ
jgi:transmembrane sensor